MSTSSARRPRTSPSATPTAPVAKGRVIFVGTGPGDPDLLTLGAVAALADASSVILDNDRQREILTHAAITLAEDAEVITIGLTEARKPLSPSARAKIVLKQASTGSRVVRLVAGDPFLDNAVADEAAACVRGGIDFEVVPGVSSLTAVPEYAGIDLIHAGGVQFASVTDGKFSKSSTAQWGAAATIVVSTVVSMVSGLVEAAKAAGRPGDDHVVVTLHGGSTEQITLTTNLDGLTAAVRSVRAPASDPVHVIIGAAAEQRHELSWYETKPLFGWRVLVPRTKDQAAPMVARLRTYGAHSEEVPTISVEPPRSPLQMDKAIRGLVEGRYEWVAFTSVNAVRAVREKFEEYGLDARAFSGLKVAAVGEVTANSLQAWGIEPDLVPAGRAIRSWLGSRVPAVRRGARPHQPRLPAASRHCHRDSGRGPEASGLGGRRRHRLPHGACDPATRADPRGDQDRQVRCRGIHVVVDRAQPGRYCWEAARIDDHRGHRAGDGADL